MKIERTTIYRLPPDMESRLSDLVRQVRPTNAMEGDDREAIEDQLGRLSTAAADAVRRWEALGEHATTVDAMDRARDGLTAAQRAAAEVRALVSEITQAMAEADRASELHLREPMKFACTAMSRRYGADRGTAADGYEAVQAKHGGAMAEAYYRMRMALDPVAVQAEEIQAATDPPPNGAH